MALGCGGTEQSACAAVEYEGGGGPDLVLVSNLPLHGKASTEAIQINEAISAELRTRGYRAGDHVVGFRACDDSTVEAGGSDPGACSANANAYADDDDVIGVIGPLDSKCAAILVPVLSRASGGAIPIVSPSDTYPCLTRGGAGCDVSEPDRYYADGVRNYLRVAASDVFQAAANAELARDEGLQRVAVLHDGEPYGIRMATSFRRAARSLGIEVVGFDAWDPDEPGYVRQFERIRSTRPDGVFLAGHLDRNGGQLIRDKVAVLGPNDGDVKLIASDGFAPAETIGAAGVAAEGMSVSRVGVPFSALPVEAKAFAAGLRAESGGPPVRTAAIHGAQAARVMLDAIARSDGTRADVIAKLFETRVTDGLVGSFGFDANGDPADATGPVVGFTVLTLGSGATVAATIEPAPATVAAAAAAGE